VKRLSGSAVLHGTNLEGVNVPEISRFLGIVIAIYYRDHGPPHFHARYGEYEVRVEIDTGRLLSGSMPLRARRLVMEWRSLHEAELVADWKAARLGEPLRPIAPLE
jgi:hypothetical protein